MFDVLNKYIVINRGDSFSCSIPLNSLANIPTDYVLCGNDSIYLGIMDPNQPFEEALVKKKYTKEDVDEQHQLHVFLTPDDTIDLFPGKYYYMLKLKIDHVDENGKEIYEVKTILNHTKFILCD